MVDGYHSWIHYFHYGTEANNYAFSTFSFVFEDQDFDSNEYYGIILDSCAAAHRVNEGDDEILDVHMPSGYPNEEKYTFNGKKVLISLNGTYASSGTSSSSLGEFILKCFAKIFSMIGDFIQKLIDRTGTDATSYDSITYSLSEIQANSDLNEDINAVKGNDVGDDEEDDDEQDDEEQDKENQDGEEEKSDGIIKEATISSKWGKTITTTGTNSTGNVAEDKICFIGDSWITGLELTGIAKSTYFNGAAGKGAQYFLNNMPNVPDDTSAIVLSLGLNCTSDWTGMNKLIDALATNYSNIPIYVLQTPHVASGYLSGKTTADIFNNGVDTFNDNVKAHCDSKDGVTWVNSASSVQDENGYLSDEYKMGGEKNGNDGEFHLNAEGYQVWYDAIISGINGNSSGTTSSTTTSIKEIPVIPIEMYSSSLEKVQLFDIDFLSTSNTNSNGLWTSISSVVKYMSRVCLYVAMIGLITTIIWRAILLVMASFTDNPRSAERSKEIINSIFKTVVYIIGVYVIIFMMVYLYKYILSMVINDNDTSYIIRLNVENVYTFNTNITGYIRYKAMSNSASACFGYSLLYMFMAIANALYFGIMLLRMIILALLTMIAPLTALSAMREDKVQVKFNIRNVFNFNVWFRLYTWFTWWPIVVVIIIRVMIMIA